MNYTLKRFEKFFSFESINIRIVLLTAFISYLLQINAIISGEPLYLIAFYTLLPWIPLCLFEGVWKVQNYAAVALLGLFTILQIGHFAEHLIQVLQIELGNGTVACPPPIDNAVNAARGVALGLRDAALAPSFYSVESIIKPGAGGQPILGPDGTLVSGPAACAVFGQLDLEIVHLVWELFGLFGTAFVLYYFRKNIFLWIAFAGLCWHALEHLTITYFYYFDQERLWDGFRQLWATYPAQGNSYVAHAAGQEAAKLNFYEAGGKFGLMAKHGMFEQLTGFSGMPGRAHLHMGYNLFITIPTVLGFLWEFRTISNKYIQMAFSGLSKNDIAKLTQEVSISKFSKDDIVFNQGDIADKCYIISRGKVDVIIQGSSGSEDVIAQLGVGQIFGEIGILDQDNSRRTATIRATTRLECLEISAETLKDLASGSGGRFSSEETKSQLIDLVLERKDDLLSKAQ